MMEVRSNGFSGGYTQSVRINRQPRFTGTDPAVKKAITGSILTHSTGIMRLFSKMGNWAPEMSSTIVTAIGTALVAPVFIAFNPFGGDKDSKTYSAWRQPISAVLAVITQIGINSKWNHYLEKVTSTGEWGAELDLSKKPDKNYLKRTLISDLKRNNKWEDFKKGEDGKPLSRKALKDKIEEIVLEKQEDCKSAAIQKELEKLNLGLTENSSIDDIKKAAISKLKEPIDGGTGYKDKLPAVLEEFTEKDFDDNNVKHSLRDNIRKKLSEKKEKVLKALDSKLDRAKNKNESLVKAAEEFVADKIVDVEIEANKSRIKGTGQCLGIILSLLTLPVSCTLLNWLYPRFMEAVFPDLTKRAAKTKEGGK